MNYREHPLEELDFQRTPLGEIMLRRRHVISLDHREIYEVKLNDEFLMSSLVNDSEIALADLGLAELDAPELDVVVGGLGLGCTAQATLRDPRVKSLLVVEYLEAVIGWHERALVPVGAELTADPRCRFVHGDFFAISMDARRNYDPDQNDRKFHAILVDIDHSPTSLLHPSHAAFYAPEGLYRVAARLQPHGVFALWSADPPEDEAVNLLRRVFPKTRAQAVTFYNPVLDEEDVNTIYIAKL